MANAIPVRAFWSYSHFDNDNEGDRIADLAKSLANEFQAITGSQLEIFIDHDLQWGDDWEARLAQAVDASTFLIPVLTPSFFRSQPCRNELLSFAAQTAKLGVSKLLMPIYWIKVRELDQDGKGANDEVVALAARHQWRDFTTVRLLEPTSAAFRQAVNAAAEELATRVDALTAESEAATERAGATEAEDPDAAGWLEQLAITEDKLPRLGEIITAIGNESIALAGIMEEHLPGVADLPATARLKVATTVATAIRPHTQRIQDLGREYANTVVEIDPGVLIMLDPLGNGLSGDPETEESNLRAALELAETVIDVRDNAMVDLLASAAESERAIRELAKTSRVFRAPAQQLANGVQGLRDGQRRFDAWAELARTQVSQHGPRLTDGDDDQ